MYFIKVEHIRKIISFFLDDRLQSEKSRFEFAKHISAVSFYIRGSLPGSVNYEIIDIRIRLRNMMGIIYALS